MGVLFPNGNITVYHYNKNNKTYTRQNICNVNLNSIRNATVSNNGINVVYTTKIIIDSSYEVYTRDIVLLEYIDKDISRLEELKGYDYITVIGKQYNNIFNTITLECK